MVSCPARAVSNADSSAAAHLTLLCAGNILQETPAEFIYKSDLFFLLCFCFQGCYVSPKPEMAIALSALTIITGFCRLSKPTRVLLQYVLLDTFVYMHPFEEFDTTKLSIFHGCRCAELLKLLFTDTSFLCMRANGLHQGFHHG